MNNLLAATLDENLQGIVRCKQGVVIHVFQDW